MKKIILRTITTMAMIITIASAPLHAITPSLATPIIVSAASTSYCESRASDGFWVVTTTSNLNVRTGAGTNYGICGKIPGGTIIHGTGKEKNGFIQIDTGRFDRKWVSKKYLQYAWFERSIVKVKTSGSNRLILRSGPGTGFSERMRIPNSTELGVIYKTKGWYYVSYQKGNNIYGGWVSTGYLTKIR